MRIALFTIALAILEYGDKIEKNWVGALLIGTFLLLMDIIELFKNTD